MSKKLLLPIFGKAGGAICVIAYLLYIYEICCKKKRPERATWLLYFVVSVTSLESQRELGGTWSLWVVYAQIGGTFVIAILSIFKGQSGWSKSDRGVIAIVIAAVIIRVFVSNYTLVVVLTVFADLTATYPTVRKAYRDPTTEPPLPWGLDSLAGGASAISAVGLSFGLWLFSAYLIVLNGTVFATILLGHRAQRLRQDKRGAQLA